MANQAGTNLRHFLNMYLADKIAYSDTAVLTLVT